MTTNAAQHTMNTAWVWGGSLLIASAVIPSALQGVYEPVIREVGFWAATLAFTAAMMLFAFGWQGSRSVVGRERYGIIGLIALALVPLAGVIVTGAIPASVQEEQSFVTAYSYSLLLLQLVAATLAVVAVWRGGAVSRPWNRVPAWGLAALVGVTVATQLIAVATMSQDQVALTLLWQVLSLVGFVVPVGLGILAIVLGMRTEPRPPVAVYPPPA